jgi:hypothetical protein
MIKFVPKFPERKFSPQAESLGTKTDIIYFVLQSLFQNPNAERCEPALFRWGCPKIFPKASKTDICSDISLG